MSLDYPTTGLEASFEIYRKRKPSVTLIVKRNVVEPTLFRNTNTDRAETQEFGDTLHAQVNGEKFTSKERLTGLDLLRRLDGHDEDSDASSDGNDAILIDKSYTYNEPGDFESSIHLDSLTYGLAGTGEQDFAIKSRVIEGYTYTTDEYDLMNKEVRNAVFESGTMRNEENEQAEALFDFVKVQPGNSLIHFVTLEAATGEMLLYVLHNILNTARYGARETRTGRNIENEVLGIVLGEHDTSLSTGELLMDYHENGASIEESIGTYVESVRRTDWDVYGDFDGAESFPDWYRRLYEIAAREASDADAELETAFTEVTTDARETLLGDD